MTYDATRLAELGRQHKRLRAQIEEVRAKLGPEILAAHLAEVQQVEIVELTGYTRESVRQICMSDEEREAIKAKRRKAQR